MIIQYLNFLSKQNIVLASGSPRRKEILQSLGIDINVVPSLFEENLNPEDFSSPGKYVEKTAVHKSDEVAGRLESAGNFPCIIVGADTCVVLNGEIFGKPKSKSDAIQMLSKLSGHSHDVFTGVSVLLRDETNIRWEKIAFFENTKVTFAALSPALIEAYVETGEPMDKAGGYGIQALGGTLVQSIVGDYFNVMGFPLHMFCKKVAPYLETFGLFPKV